ncbi:MAG: RNA-binding protein [Desulfobacteraceae bacterium]|nr:MAG: RNA-binding protein [Desulfobacteraceae bacterium]
MEAEEMVGRAARALAVHPEALTIREISGKRVSIVELTVSPEDFKTFSNRRKKDAETLRDITAAAAKKLNKILVLEIVGQTQPKWAL